MMIEVYWYDAGVSGRRSGGQECPLRGAGNNSWEKRRRQEGGEWLKALGRVPASALSVRAAFRRSLLSAPHGCRHPVRALAPTLLGPGNSSGGPRRLVPAPQLPGRNPFPSSFPSPRIAPGRRLATAGHASPERLRAGPRPARFRFALRLCRRARRARPAGPAHFERAEVRAAHGRDPGRPAVSQRGRFFADSHREHSAESGPLESSVGWRRRLGPREPGLAGFLRIR